MKNQKPKTQTQKKPKTRIQKAKILIFLICVFVFWFLVFGLASAKVEDLEDQIRQVVRDYAIQTYPRWAEKKVVISFRPGDTNLERVDKWGTVEKCELLNLYSGFRPVGMVSLPLRLTTKEGKKQVALITAKIEVFDSVAVAKYSKKKGEAFMPGDLVLEEKDVSLLGDKYYTALQALEGMVVTTAVGKGDVLQPWMVKPSPVVSKGNRVALIFCSPHVMVNVQGKVLEDGYLDQKVKVQREGNRKIFEGRVVSSQEVEVVI